MIRVTIEMLPRGDESKKRHMGTVDIANDGTGTDGTGNYKVRLSRMDSPTRAWKSGAIKGFNRLTRGPHDLLLLALLSLVGDRNRRILDELKAEYEAATPLNIPVEQSLQDKIAESHNANIQHA